jgi:hypothetical protein
MKNTLIILLLGCNFLFSQNNPKHEKVSGYKKKDGTRVEPYKRTEKDNTQKNNFDSKPNVNPYTGKKGYKTPKK